MAIRSGLGLNSRRHVTSMAALLSCLLMMPLALVGCSSGSGSQEKGADIRSTREATGDTSPSAVGRSPGKGTVPGKGTEDTTGGDWRGGTRSSAPAWQPTGSPGGQGGGNWKGDGHSDKDGGKDRTKEPPDREKQQDIAWLPWGPKSPTTETTTDERHAYDLLQAGQCRQALDMVRSWGSSRLSWTVLEGLAGACLSAQGQQDGWDTAVAADAKLSKVGYRPDPEWCKEEDAYTTLKRLTAFHRAYPRGKVRLVGNAPHVMACDSGITGVAPADGGKQVHPGERVTVSGTWPSKPTEVVLTWGNGGSKTITGNWSESSSCCERAQVWFPFPGELAGKPYSVLLSVVGDGFTLRHRIDLVVDWSSPAAQR